jgi:ArsR family transcriptional regulator
VAPPTPPVTSASCAGPADACCAPLTGEPLSAEAAAALARTFKAVADPARLRLLSLVAAHEGGEACVCDLVEPLGLSQPTVSHHLKVLVEAGLLTRDKRGVWAWFALVPEALDALSAVLATPGPLPRLSAPLRPSPGGPA